MGTKKGVAMDALLTPPLSPPTSQTNVILELAVPHRFADCELHVTPVAQSVGQEVWYWH